MAKVSKIAWTDGTFNAVIGCQKVSPGCKYCYAEHETFVRRERSHGRELWGPTGTRYKTSAEYWKQPISWNREQWWECTNCGWRGRLPNSGACPICIDGKLITTRMRIFCESLGDILEDRKELVPIRNKLIDLVENTSNLDWLFLTKRIELATDLLPYDWFNKRWPLNVWMGVSVENQEYADLRIFHINKIPSGHRFLSVEPMLEHMDIGEFEGDWVIVGGESGRFCRPFEWDWARYIRNQCLDSGISFFMKQGGGSPDKRDQMKDLPEDLRIREWPK